MFVKQRLDIVFIVLLINSAFTCKLPLVTAVFFFAFECTALFSPFIVLKNELRSLVQGRVGSVGLTSFMILPNGH